MSDDFDDAPTPSRVSRNGAPPMTASERERQWREHYKKHPRGTPVVQTSDDRALASSARRREERMREFSDGVVTVPPMPAPRQHEDITSPWAVLERDLPPTQTDRARRDTDEPATVGDVLKVISLLLDERSSNAERDKAYEAVLKSPHEIAAELMRRIGLVEKAHKAARRIVVAAVLASGGLVGAAASGFLEGERTKARDAERLNQVEDVNKGQQEDIRELRAALGRSSSRIQAPSSRIQAPSSRIQAPAPGWLAPPVALTSKGPQP